MEDRRAARRFLMSLPVELNVPAAPEPRRASARTRDVSYRGLYFTVNRDLQAGSPIEFVLTLPKEITLSGDVRVQCAGRVVRVEKLESAGGGEGGQVGVAAVIEQYDFLAPPA